MRYWLVGSCVAAVGVAGLLATLSIWRQQSADVRFGGSRSVEQDPNGTQHAAHGYEAPGPAGDGCWQHGETVYDLTARQGPADDHAAIAELKERAAMQADEVRNRPSMGGPPAGYDRDSTQARVEAYRELQLRERRTDAQGRDELAVWTAEEAGQTIASVTLANAGRGWVVVDEGWRVPESVCAILEQRERLRCSEVGTVDISTTADTAAVADTPEEAVKIAVPDVLSTLQYDRLVSNDTGDRVDLFKGEELVATAQLVRRPGGWNVHHFEYCMSPR